MIKAIIFDCFGVLVGQGFEHTYRIAGGDPKLDRSFIESTLGQANLGLISDDEFRNAMADKLGIPIKQWQEAVKSAELPDRELLTYIKGLRPKYKTAVLSNANRGVLERKIGAEQLKECFDQVIVSAEIGMVKPDPRIYSLSAERLNVALQECIFIDDRQPFLDVAARLGMKVILYKDFEDLKKSMKKLLV